MDNYPDIIERCKQREQEAQIEFYSLFCKSVYASCFRILGNAEEAEDIMQETFIKILNNPERYDTDQEGMRRILNRIAVNASIDRYRKKKKSRFTELKDNYDYSEDFSEDTETEIQMKLEAIYRNLSLLPEGYRVILSLHLIEGMEYQEIAKKLKISASTVRSQFTRAKAKLIELIQNDRIS